MSQTVQRAIDMLEFCSERPRSLREISDQANVHRTTALRLLQTLEASGFVRRDEHGRFGVGFRLAALAESALDQFDLRSLVHPHIAALSEQTGQTVQFAVPQGDGIVYVDKIEPRSAIRLDTRIGGRTVVHTAGVSKAILANLAAESRDRIIDAVEFTAYTNSTITSAAELRRRLTEVRQLGWAYDDGEYESLSNCIAAPVWDHRHNVVGAISVTAIKTRHDLASLRDFLPALLATTDAVSAELGSHRPNPDAVSSTLPGS